jgi:hypothetical protein
MSFEICCHCGNETGRAGRGEDSIYAGDLGPFCPDCRDNFGEILSTEIDRRDETINNYKKLLADEREETIRLHDEINNSYKQQLATARNDALKEAAEMAESYGDPEITDSIRALKTKE